MGEKKRNTDRSEWVIFENHHEAIIAKDDFEKCRCEFDNNAKKKAEKKGIAKEIAARFPNHFEGIIYCGNGIKMLLLVLDALDSEISEKNNERLKAEKDTQRKKTQLTMQMDRLKADNGKSQDTRSTQRYPNS